MNSRNFAVTAFTLAAVASAAALAQDKGASIKGDKERCYGISLAGATQAALAVQGNADLERLMANLLEAGAFGSMSSATTNNR